MFEDIWCENREIFSANSGVNAGSWFLDDFGCKIINFELSSSVFNSFLTW